MKTLAILLTIASGAFAAEYHVAVTGNDTADGTAAKPLKTIAAAASKALPGDTVTVHAGGYRERVDPPRGGESDAKRIIYQAAPGERVTLTGAEPAKGWEKVAGDTWKLTLPNSDFGNFNPYSDIIRGDWFSSNGRVHHTGCVYLNGDWLTEAVKLDDVMKPAGKAPLWFATVAGDDGAYLLNLAWLKPSGGPRVAGGEPAARYGGKPAPCSEGGQCSGFIRGGDWLRFDAVDFGNLTDKLELRAAAPANAGGLIELRLDSPAGELLGTCRVEPTGDWQQWRSFTAEIKPTKGKHPLYLVFKNPKAEGGNTTIHAQFPGQDPNREQVEINCRQTVFYPSRNRINYLTIRGFVLEKAATTWAPPSAEQVAVIGTNWSKGWIIENNTIRYSKCSGISLGKYGDGTDNTNDAGAADPYTACVRRALENGWNKDTIGSHLVRNNQIHHCEQTGIVGSMGCAFSTITGNEIHDIHVRRLFGGAEMAGIKLHGAIDVVIRGNHIYHTNRGIWLDWMAQGAQVVGNLLHHNSPCEDIFCEMQHGPLLIANNLLLSPGRSFLINSKGLAIVHNLIVGPISCTPFDGRNTPYHPPHATAIAGLHNAPGGDHRVYNNVFTAPASAKGFDNAQLEMWAAGNVFTKNTSPSKFDQHPLLKPEFDPAVKLTEKADGWYLEMNADPKWATEQSRQPVTTALLGKAKVPNLPYENPDGSPLKLDTDYFGNPRAANHPFPGPFEITKDGQQEFKVWPRSPGAR